MLLEIREDLSGKSVQIKGKTNNFYQFAFSWENRAILGLRGRKCQSKGLKFT